MPILNGEVYLPDVGYTTAKNYDDEGNLIGETAEAEPTPYQKTANCKKYEAELGWNGLMSPSGKSLLLQDIAILQPLATTCIYVKLMILEVKF